MSSKRLGAIRVIVLFLLASLVNQQASAAESKKAVKAAPEKISNISWLDFRINQLSFFQSNGNNFSGGLSWAPAFHLTRSLNLRGDVGVGLIRGFPNLFLEGSYQVFLSYLKFNPVRFEVGGGLQTWIGYDSYPELSTNVEWVFEKKKMFIIDRTFLGYSGILIPGNFTHAIQLGVGLSF